MQPSLADRSSGDAERRALCKQIDIVRKRDGGKILGLLLIKITFVTEIRGADFESKLGDELGGRAHHHHIGLEATLLEGA